MNKLSKPSKRLQLIEASKKRLVFELPPDPIPGCGYALAIYAVIALAITIAILLFRRREPSDLFWIPIVGLIWGVLFCSLLEWMWLVRERKLVVVEPFRIVLEILSGSSRSSEEIELGSTAWAELIRYRESDDGVVHHEVRVHGEVDYLDIVLGLPSEESEWLVEEINHFLNTFDPLEAVSQPWTTLAPVLDGALGPPPGSRIQIAYRSPERVTIDIKRRRGQFSEACLPLGIFVLGIPLLYSVWLFVTDIEIVPIIFWTGVVIWQGLIAIFSAAMANWGTCWSIDLEKSTFTLRSIFWGRVSSSRQITLLPATRAELIVKSTLNGVPNYVVAITSPIRQIQFGYTLSLTEQFWLARAINRVFRATTACPRDLVTRDSDAFELAPQDLPSDSSLLVTESTKSRLAIHIPFINSAVIRRAGTWLSLIGSIGILSMCGWYGSPVALLAEEVPFVAMVCFGALIIFWPIVQLRTDVEVSEDALVCVRRLPPFRFTTTIPRRDIRFVGIVRLAEDGKGSLVPLVQRVRRPTLYRVTCGIGTARNDILLQIGFSYDECAQLAALLRYSMRTTEESLPQANKAAQPLTVR